MVLHIHKARLDKLSMVDIANDFVFQRDHRKTLFGRFDDVDLRRKTIPVKSVRMQVNIKNWIFIYNKKYILSPLFPICCLEFAENYYLIPNFYLSHTISSRIGSQITNKQTNKKYSYVGLACPCCNVQVKRFMVTTTKRLWSASRHWKIQPLFLLTLVTDDTYLFETPVLSQNLKTYEKNKYTFPSY